ncbi:MAG: methyl-accepting chemotaxis protein [Defluviitaleaceae bacterium]|nr:methyl-accepting chemotaxis protein [Defluviitaleaceae bacterium]
MKLSALFKVFIILFIVLPVLNIVTSILLGSFGIDVIGFAILGVLGVLGFSIALHKLKPINRLTLAVSDISNGKFNTNIDSIYSGETGTLATEIRKLSDTVNVFHDSTTRFSAKVQNGDLNAKIDSAKFHGSWANLATSLNQLVEATNKPCQEITSLLEKLREGDFRGRVETQYSGVFRDMSGNLNTSLDQLESYVGELQDTLSKISEGNLQHKIHREYVGSFDFIKRAMNSILTRLNTTMDSIRTVAEGVSIGADSFSQGAVNLALGAEDHSRSMAVLAEKVFDVNNRSKRNTESAQKAAEWSLTSRDSAQAGNAEMKKLLDAMEQIAGFTTQISKINRTIDGIAFQTNILALNAAVEAANAGTHGKGFAVVANEVRKLAIRTSEAAKEVEILMSKAVNSIIRGKEMAYDSAQSLDNIVSNVVSVSGAISEIYEASMHQTESVDDINNGLQTVMQRFQSDAATGEETATAAAELNGQIHELKERLDFFQTRLSMPSISTIWEGATATEPKFTENAAGSRRHYQDGEVIISEGDTNADSMYFIIGGKVGVFKAYGKVNQTLLATLDEGCLFGEMSLFLKEPRTATIVAEGSVTIAEITEANMYELMNNHPNIAFAIARTLCARLRNMLRTVDAY